MRIRSSVFAQRPLSETKHLPRVQLQQVLGHCLALLAPGFVHRQYDDVPRRAKGLCWAHFCALRATPNVQWLSGDTSSQGGCHPRCVCPDGMPRMMLWRPDALDCGMLIHPEACNGLTPNPPSLNPRPPASDPILPPTEL